MVVIGEAVVDESIFGSLFCCDLDECKGVCCYVEGGRGAPLENDEVLEIAKAFPIIKDALTAEGLEVIESVGLVEGHEGSYATPCVNDRDCVYLVREKGIARCSFEIAYQNGLIDWQKPISCHLFPLRIRGFENDHIMYEVIDECSGGRIKGEEKNVTLVGFLRDSLVRQYGEEWYSQFVEYCDSRNGSSRDSKNSI